MLKLLLIFHVLGLAYFMFDIECNNKPFTHAIVTFYNFLLGASLMLKLTMLSLICMVELVNGAGL